LNGFWDFAFLGDVDPDAVDTAGIEFNERMAVPGCFDATPDYAGKRGLAAYRTRILLPDAARHRLIFDGVNHWCRVLADGKSLVDHLGGHTRFSADVTDHQPGEIDVVVLVDNRFDYDRCPLHLDHMDWFHHGGIARPVELHRLGDLWIESMQLVTQDWRKRRIAMTLTFQSEKEGRAPLAITCDGKEILTDTVELKENRCRLRAEFHLPDTEPWSPDAPNLHLIHARLDSDDLRQRIGIRQVRTEGRSILLNDEPIILHGVCRHELHPDFGCGLPDAQIAADVQVIKKMGCNFVRGTHYPQDPRFLDLCDEAGICVFSESIGWQHTVEHLNDPNFIKAQLNNIDEMVAVSINHPSVIIWGVLNERASYEEGARKAYETLLGRLRELDPSRPVSYATFQPDQDKCFDLCDIASLNPYFGWYRCDIEDIPAELDKYIAHVDAAGFPDMPVLISETGAGAVAGYRDWYMSRWSEDYQAQLLDKAIGHLLFDSDRVCGVAIWQLFDCRSFQKLRGVLTRPRGYNSKGLLDEYRRPKLAYDIVKKRFNALKDA